jgi:hypothetical protein
MASIDSSYLEHTTLDNKNKNNYPWIFNGLFAVVKQPTLNKFA